MDSSRQKGEKKNKITEVRTFPVPSSPLIENQESITITTNTPSKPSKEQIISRAISLHSQGKISEAAKYYQYCINNGFNDPRVFNNYGILLQENSKSKEAASCVRKAIELKPDFAEAYSNLSNILRGLGELREAESLLRKAIAIKPNLALAHCNLGNILKDLGDLQEAEISYLKAIELKPDLAEAHANLGAILLRDLGNNSDALKYLSAATKYDPNNTSHFINSNLRLSPIMESNSQIDRERNQYKKEINNLKKKDNMYFQNKSFFNSSIFYLPYQNRPDDRLILEDFADAISKSKGIIFNGFSHTEYIASTSKRRHLKIGVCSMYLREGHSVGRCFINVLKDLSETDIDMTIYIVPEDSNHSVKNEINESFKKVIKLPNCPKISAKMILDDQLDLIFYPDIGMNSFTYLLALSRLALVQVSGLGHGSTSGIKNVDYYITHGNEPTKSNTNYTETLTRFRRLPFNFAIPKINENNVTLKNTINSPSKFYIGLIQSLFKIHPSYDEILESILLNIKNAYLVLITDKDNYKYKLIKERWRKKNILLIERSIFFNRMGRDDLLHITRSCDIMLDPFYFGGGVTFYEAMTYGIPCITYPHNQKVRIASAGYKQMKISNPPIAISPEDYINWCKIYAEDKILLESTKKELRQNAEKYLFNDNEIYKDYYEFFKRSVKESKEKFR